VALQIVRAGSIKLQSVYFDSLLAWQHVFLGTFATPPAWFVSSIGQFALLDQLNIGAYEEVTRPRTNIAANQQAK
jgi:hypothetical protein